MHDFSNTKNENYNDKIYKKKILSFHHKLYIFISRLELQLTTYQTLEFLVGYREQEQRKWEK